MFFKGLYVTFESTIILETKFGCLINKISFIVSMFWYIKDIHNI